jgi:D-beta-D-heptose 7-phosphate kinase/D-beta-D-heptose 1-phosphate adenosyltransferase
MTELATTQQQKQFKILVIGDLCTDIYQYGTVDRISPEAPVPVFNFSYQEQRAGMAGNVVNNLETLGCEVTFLHDQCSTKTRLIDSRSKQHIVRIDNDVESTPIEFATAIPYVYDAVVISDYDKGTVTYELMEEIIQWSRHSSKVPVFIDTKKTDLARLQGAWVKINQLEFSKVVSTCSGMIVTLGPAGARRDSEIFPAPKVEVSDVCGAGDTFLAALAYWYVQSKNMEQAVKFAVRASAVTVQHLGVYAPTVEEIL